MTIYLIALLSFTTTMSCAFAAPTWVWLISLGTTMVATYEAGQTFSRRRVR